MCKVIINDPMKEVDFIIYNHLLSKNKNYKFTINQLVRELYQYNLRLEPDEVQKEVNSFIELGLVNQNFRHYSVCG